MRIFDESRKIAEQWRKEKFETNMDMRKFDEFVKLVKFRMQAGAKTYGDNSIDKKCDHLIDEIQQELEDVAGWASILWAKLEQLRANQLSRLHRADPNSTTETKDSA